MADDEKKSPLLLCTACGRPAEPGQHFCEHCGAPLTAYAFVDPVFGIRTEGYAAHKATTNPQKRIVVVGMWLWMVPMLFFGLLMTRMGIGIVVEGLSDGQNIGLIGLLAVGLGLTMAWIAGGILFKTTLRYMQRNATEPPVDEGEETVECLDCGESFEANVEACPKCGWSYTSTT